MAKRAVIFLADGFEEVEAVTPVDFLRRAGIEVVAVSLNDDKKSTGAHQISVIADMSLTEFTAGFDADAWDAVLLPGGMPGSANLAASEKVGNMLKAFAGKGKLVAAICAAPAAALYPLGLLAGRSFTCYPGLEEKVAGGKWSADKVVVDGNIITSRAAGTAAAWAIAITGYLLDGETAQRIAASTLN
jgi:4-methyl-5(b-hydroxyethyl)-thiazole monophosphate biosynthesis